MKITMRRIMQWLFGMLFILAGCYHFLDTEFFVKIMPSYLPWHRELVYVSGVFEVFLGVMLLIPFTSTIAAWGLIVLLIAVFPANLHMAMNATEYPGFSPFLLWMRLPFQGVLIGWAYCFTWKSDFEKHTM